MHFIRGFIKFFADFLHKIMSCLSYHGVLHNAILCTYSNASMCIHDPLTVHIMKISNPLRSEGVLLVEAVTSFIGGGS